MRKHCGFRWLCGVAVAGLATWLTVGPGGASTAQAAPKEYRVAWSHYTGWEPWGYAAQSGILEKWAKKYGIAIRLDLVNDYIESINLYTGGKYQACVMTNMDALTIPAVGGIDSTALILGDFSNGNDGIVARGAKDIKALKGRDVKLVELSVSHYLLTRALDQAGMKEKDIRLVNTSDADMGSVYLADANAAAVTWNPILMQLTKDAKSTLLFDSAKIPGEIMDLMVVRTEAPEELKKALAGAWYETMALMAKGDAAALAAMAKQAGSSDEDFKAQLKTTEMFYDPAKAAAFMKGAKPKETMEYVRTFSFDHGLFGNGAKSKDLVGIAFADGSTLGDPKNIKLRFDATWMQMAADGKL